MRELSILKKYTMLVCLPAVFLSVSACTYFKGVEVVEGERVMQTDDSIIVVDTLTLNATVTAMDAAKNKITLSSPDGGKSTYKITPGMVDFNTIHVGDEVSAVVSEQVAVYLGSARPASDVQGSIIISADGSRTGIVVETKQVEAVIESIDLKKRKVTFRLPDGTTKKVKARKQVDLTVLNPGDEVTVLLGLGLALSVQHP